MPDATFPSPGLGRLSALGEVVRKRLPHGRSPVARAKVRRYLREGVIETPHYGDLAFADGALWDGTHDRSIDRYAHGFLWLVDWAATVQEEEDAARAAYDQTIRWHDLSPQWRDDDDSLAFHDETTAQRLLMHLGIIDAQRSWLSEQELARLEAIVDEMAALQLDEGFHAGLNNHGMFQDIALVSWAALADWADEDARTHALDVAVGRLNAYFRHAFTSEGVHVEHAPSYHLMVARQLAAHLDVLHAIDHASTGEFERLLAGTVGYATHAVTPDAVYPPISDTTIMPLTSQAGFFDDDGFAYAVTGGKRGTEPPTRTLVPPESGYAIHRSAWGDRRATFVYFSCSYNNAYHKHADENSLFLRHRGLDLISEAGPFGYNYSDPLTRYGYSQYAHSTLVVDGVSIPRHGGPLENVTLTSHDADGPGFHVTGRNARLAGVVHERTVQVSEAGGWVQLSVTDDMITDTDHDYELLWHVGDGLEVILHGQGYELHRGATKVMDVMFSSDVPLQTSVRRGVRGNKPQGWRFPKMGEAVASSVVVVSFRGARCSVSTEIRLHDFLYRSRDVSPRHGWKRADGEVGLNYLRVRGRSQDKLVVAFTSLHQRGDFTFNYKPTLDAAAVEALYILDDFGDQGAYYLQDHGDRAIFRSVQALLRSQMEELGLQPSDLVFVGSSKGATAALMHGMALGVGEIFIGGPQTKIGTFLSKPHPNVLEFMTGGTTQEHIAALDAVVFDLAAETRERWRDTQITILVGDKDHHYRGHVLPFVEHAHALGGRIRLVTLPGHTHGTFGPAYRDALATHLGGIATGAPEPSPLVVSAVAGPGEVTASVTAGEWPQYAARLYRGSEQVEQLPYGPRRPLVFTGLPAGRYRVRVFARIEPGEPDAAQTTGWVTVE